MKLAIIGTGNMAEAIIAGLLSKKVLRPNQIVGCDINNSRLKFIAKKYGIQKGSSIDEVAKKSSILLLAVKPQQFTELLTTLRPSMNAQKLVLSIAAGIDTAFIQKKLGHLQKRQKIIRLMPNTPALVNEGATVFFANRFCTKTEKQITQKLFGAVGLVREVKQENLLDAVTALSGSGPAFTFKFIEALTNGGVKNGLSTTMALQLAIQTVKGAAILIQQTGENPKNLIAKVTSKGGTTESGLKVLHEKKFENTVKSCLQAATHRSKQLRKNVRVN